MNQNENKNQKEKKNNTKNKMDKKQYMKRKRVKRKIRMVFLAMFILFSLCILVGTLIFNFKYGKDFSRFQTEAKQSVNESTLDTFRQSETSLVYDTNGDLTSVLKGEKDVYYLDYKDIPNYAIEAMIAIEDKKFMTHSGIDIKANFRALVALIKNKGDITQGASTITQQLARNIFLSNEVVWERKIKEIFIALELEKKYNKNQIMEFYLNNIYFANGYYGIQAASKGYFSKTVDELSLSQIAFLCAIPNNPTLYNPLEKPDNTKKRGDRILLQMFDDGKIGQEEYQDACNEKIKIVEQKTNKNNYVETYVYYSATRALMEQQGFEFRNKFEDKEDRELYEEKYYELYNLCQKSLYYEGYRIYTSIDLEKQKLLQGSVDETLADYTEKNEEGTYSLQGAAVSVDNNTGRVVAIVGGRYQETVGYTLNRGYQSFRQPGSAIKPLIVYTPSFERNYYPDDIVVDEAIKDGPKNSNGVYSGAMELRRAIELSKNSIAWKLFEELTPEVGIPYLLEMNFAKIVKDDYFLAASLGGFTTGVSPLEMTAAYATLENDGVYRDPTCIIKILDAQGKEIVSEKNTEKRIYNSNAARMMTDVLTGVIKNGTGAGLGLDNMPSAGKTGTTNQKKDGWFVGYTPYYTTGVWVGYDIPKAMNELSGASFPGTIWKNYMNTIHSGLETMQFAQFEDKRPPEEVIKQETKETEELDTKDKGPDKPGKDKKDDKKPEKKNTEESIESQENTTEEEIDWNDYDEESQDPEIDNEDTLEELPPDTGLTEDEGLWSEADGWEIGEDTP